MAKKVERVNWEIRDGTKARIWEDNWLRDEVPLTVKINREIDDDQRGITVNALVREDGNGNWWHLDGILRQEEFQKIQSVLPSKMEYEHDKIC